MNAVTPPQFVILDYATDFLVSARPAVIFPCQKEEGRKEALSSSSGRTVSLYGGGDRLCIPPPPHISLHRGGVFCHFAKGGGGARGGKHTGIIQPSCFQPFHLFLRSSALFAGKGVFSRERVVLPHTWIFNLKKPRGKTGRARRDLPCIPFPS